MYCLQYKTVVIYLKRTEVCWLVKSTFNIAIRPYLRLEPVYRFGCPKMSPKKRAVLHHQEVPFFQTDKLISFVLNLLKVGHLTRLLLRQVLYGRRKPWRFHTHTHKTSKVKPHALQLLPIEHATGDHSEKLEHCLCVFQNY